MLSGTLLTHRSFTKQALSVVLLSKTDSDEGTEAFILATLKVAVCVDVDLGGGYIDNDKHAILESFQSVSETREGKMD